MNFGNGSIGFVNKNSAGGGSADNGVSVKAGNTVLGNDLGDAAKPGQLLDNRDLWMENFFIRLLESTSPNQFNGLLRPWQIVFGDSVTGNRVAALDASTSIMQLLDGDTNKPKISLGISGGANRQSAIANDNGVLKFGISSLVTAIFKFFLATGNMVVGDQVDNGARLQVDGDITTGDPGAGVGKWRLGKKAAGAVALDAANYIEVKIDGVVYKLGIVV